jgi:nucleoside transporter
MLVRTRLSVMMFLQYFVWGAWWVTLATYLSNVKSADGHRIFSDTFVGSAYGASAIAAMITPFFIGMIADRFFSTERLLCVLHLLGAGFIWYLSTIVTPQAFYVVLILYFVTYMPTLALTNSLSFHHLSDPAKEFPAIRLSGTIGWIVAGLVVGSLLIAGKQWGLHFEHPLGLPFTLQLGEQLGPDARIEPTAFPMQVAAVAQAILGVFCLVLPHTPPSKRESQSASDVLGLSTLGLMKEWSFFVFIVGAFLICIPLQFYYSFANQFFNELHVANAAAKQTYGQMLEVVFLAMMPFLLVRLGVKWMLVVGMGAWGLRYLLFANGNADERMWMLYIGILLHGICYDFFFVTCQIYVDNKAAGHARASAQGFVAFVTLGLGLFVGSIVSGPIVEHYETPAAAIKHNWFSIWLVPAGMAVIVMVMFALLFRERGDGRPPHEVDLERATRIPEEAPR